MVDMLGRCPRCGGNTQCGEGLVAQVVCGIDDVIWDGDLGEEYCVGSFEGEWEDYCDQPDEECGGCGWRQRIGDVDGYDDAVAIAKAEAACEMAD